MKILIISDIHSEFWLNSGESAPRGFFANLPDPLEYDIVVAAGDITAGPGGPRLLREMFVDKPIIYVVGNHEYYNNDYYDINRQVATAAEINGVFLLNPGIVTIDDYRFIGATLWTDFHLNGYQSLEPYHLRGFNDFRLITAGDERMSHQLMRKTYKQHVAFIKKALAKSTNIDKTVVITHFVPSQLCTHPKYFNNPMNPYFINDCDHLMDQYKYPVHIFGHTHDCHDVVHRSGTRLVCNPLGYPNEFRHEYQHKIIEL